MDLEIEKTLIISTSHITEKDMDKLTSLSPAYPYTLLITDYGVMLALPSYVKLPPRSNSIAFITEIDFEEWTDKYSDAFLEILRIAKEKECLWVNFDCDGSEYDLPKFDW